MDTVYGHKNFCHNYLTFYVMNQFKKIYENNIFAFLLSVEIVMAQILEMFPHGRQGLLFMLLSTPQLLMTCGPFK